VLKLARWIADYFGFEDTRAPVARFDTLLGISCAAGHLEMARWLADRFGRNVHRPSAYDALRWAGLSGNLPLVEWVVAWLTSLAGGYADAIYPTLRVASVDVLRSTRAGQRADVVRWLIARFGLSAAEQRGVYEDGRVPSGIARVVLLDG